MTTNKIGLPSSNPNDWTRHSGVNVPGVTENIIEPLYDKQTYPAAGAQSILFFQDPKGSNGKSVEETNMDLGGQLPSGKKYKVTGISVELLVDNNLSSSAGNPGFEFIDDVRTFAENGSLTFIILAKPYLRQAPLGLFPAPHKFEMNVVTGGESLINTAYQYSTVCGRKFSITPKTLIPNQNFIVELNDLPALPSGIDAEIQVTLWGILNRNAQ